MKSFPFVFLLLLLASCRFIGPKTTVEGEVYDPISDKPITGLSIILRDQGSYISSGRNIIDEVKTDNDGKFYFDFYANNINYYRCEVIDFKSDSFVTVENTSVTMRVYADQDNFLFFKVAPLSETVGMEVFLNNPLTVEGWGWRARHTKISWWAPYERDSTWQQLPPTDSVALYYGGQPYGHYRFEWYVIRQGDTTFYQDTVYAPRGGEGIIRKTF